MSIKASIKPERTGLAVLFLVACALVWGSNVVVGRAVHAGLPPVGLAFWRNAVALLALLPFTWRELAAQWPMAWRGRGVILAAGVVGTALFNYLTYRALHSTTAISAGLMMSLTPVAVPAMALVLLRDRLTWRQGAGIAVSLAGVAAIVTRGDLSHLAALSFNAGDLTMIGAMLCWSFYSVVIKRKQPALGPYVFLTAVLACAVPVLLPFYLWESLSGAPMPATPTAVAASLYLGLVPTAVALLLFNHAVQIIGPIRAGPYAHLVPVFAALLAILFLGERLAAFHFVGAAFIAIGLYLATQRARS
jgi:drug/metabolite transporter (DMT)-like permease